MYMPDYLPGILRLLKRRLKTEDNPDVNDY